MKDAYKIILIFLPLPLSECGEQPPRLQMPAYSIVHCSKALAGAQMAGYMQNILK